MLVELPAILCGMRAKVAMMLWLSCCFDGSRGWKEVSKVRQCRQTIRPRDNKVID